MKKHALILALLMGVSPLFAQTNLADLKKGVEEFSAQKKAVEQALSGKKVVKQVVKKKVTPATKVAAKKASTPRVKQKSAKKVSAKKDVSALDVINSAKKAVQ